MWTFIALLCAVILGLLKWVLDLKQQLRLHQNEEEHFRAALKADEAKKNLLIAWIRQQSRGKEFADYFREQGIRRIAIYGMTDVGELLYQILKDTDIEVVCGIDRSKKSESLPVVKPADFQEHVDAIVVAPIRYFSEIYDTMRAKVGGDTPIWSLDEVLFEVSRYMRG